MARRSKKKTRFKRKSKRKVTKKKSNNTNQELIFKTKSDWIKKT